MGHAVALRHYGASRKVAGSTPDEKSLDFLIDLNLPAAMPPCDRLSF
jgi:hypothetical protein